MQDNQVVELVISLGPKPTYIEVPSVLGMKTKDALLLLNQRGLSIRKLDRVYSEQEEGTILSQSIDPGSRVKEREQIVLVESLGPENEPEPENPPETQTPFNPVRFQIDLTRIPEGQQKNVLIQTRIDQNDWQNVYEQSHTYSTEPLIIEREIEVGSQYRVYVADELIDEGTITP